MELEIVAQGNFDVQTENIKVEVAEGDQSIDGIIPIEVESAAYIHIKTVNGPTLRESVEKGGCGECQTSCQSAAKTSNATKHNKCENALRFRLGR